VKEMTINFSLLRRRLETKRESLLEELKPTAFVAARQERGSYGEQGELATEIVEAEKAVLVCSHKLLKQETPYEIPMMNPSVCQGCGDCVRACPLKAIKIVRM